MLTADVIIQGAGIVGSTLALLLAQASRSVLLIDHLSFSIGQTQVPAGTTGIASFTPRVSALSLASQTILTAAAAWPANARLAPYRRMRVMPVTATTELVLDAADIGAPYLGVIAENDVLLQALHQQIRQQPLIKWISQTSIESVQQSAVQVQVQMANVTAQALLLVAADGGQSRLHQLVPVALKRTVYGHSALVSHLHLTQPHDWQAQQVFLDTGPVAFLPLTARTHVLDCPPSGNAERYVSLVWSGPAAQQQALAQLTEAEFLMQLNRLLPSNLGQVVACQPRHIFPLLRQNLAQTVCQRVVFVGDAARRMHPLAGQGLNLGLLDAACLAQQVLSTEDLGNPMALNLYQQARQAQGGLMEDVVHRLYQQYRPQTPWWQQVLGQQALHWAAQSSLLKTQMMRIANAEADLPAGYRVYWPKSF